MKRNPKIIDQRQVTRYQYFYSRRKGMSYSTGKKYDVLLRYSLDRWSTIVEAFPGQPFMVYRKVNGEWYRRPWTPRPGARGGVDYAIDVPEDEFLAGGAVHVNMRGTIDQWRADGTLKGRDLRIFSRTVKTTALNKCDVCHREKPRDEFGMTMSGNMKHLCLECAVKNDEESASQVWTGEESEMEITPEELPMEDPEELVRKNAWYRRADDANNPVSAYVVDFTADYVICRLRDRTKMLTFSDLLVYSMEEFLRDWESMDYPIWWGDDVRFEDRGSRRIGFYEAETDSYVIYEENGDVFGSPMDFPILNN